MQHAVYPAHEASAVLFQNALQACRAWSTAAGLDSALLPGIVVGTIPPVRIRRRPRHAVSPVVIILAIIAHKSLSECDRVRRSIGDGLRDSLTYKTWCSELYTWNTPVVIPSDGYWTVDVPILPLIAVNVLLTREAIGWAKEAGDPRVVDRGVGRVGLGADVATGPAKVSCVVKWSLLDIGQEQGLGAPGRPGRERTRRTPGRCRPSCCRCPAGNAPTAEM